jgi:hypothetical protein
MKVYLVYFFQDYIDMYYATHSVQHVVTSKDKAIELVNSENQRLKRRQDYNRDQNAYFEEHDLI